jgi:hypothetical protein
MKIKSENPIPYLTHKKIFEGELEKIPNRSLYVFRSSKFKEIISETLANKIINICDKQEKPKLEKKEEVKNETENKPKKRGRPAGSKNK